MIKNIFLDFDGVICDSSLETARAGWFAGSEIWDEWKGRDVPYNHLKRYRKLRPLIETGHEAIALMKAIDEDYSDSFLKENFNFIMNQFFTSASYNTENLVKLFGDVRDNWIKADPDSWIKWHRFYPGINRFMAFCSESFNNVYIITRKEKRFAEMLLAAGKIEYKPKNIFGLETGKSKKEIIEDILCGNTRKKVSIIIEDRLKTIYSFMKNPNLDSSYLCLASWGYVLPEEVSEALQNERIVVLKIGTLKNDVLSLIEE